MTNASLHQLALFVFLFLVASGLTQQRGDQCNTNNDCVKFCVRCSRCPVLCYDGYCFCYWGSTEVHTQRNKL
ncbi:hypothetical protein CR513_26398, partial [Mucuna pruriens]